MKIKQNEIDKVLEGIGNGFSWRNSDQGYDYWEDVKDNLLKLGANRQAFSYTYVPSPNISLCKQAMTSLLNAFIWRESP